MKSASIPDSNPHIPRATLKPEKRSKPNIIVSCRLVFHVPNAQQEHSTTSTLYQENLQTLFLLCEKAELPGWK